MYEEVHNQRARDNLYILMKFFLFLYVFKPHVHVLACSIASVTVAFYSIHMLSHRLVVASCSQLEGASSFQSEFEDTFPVGFPDLMQRVVLGDVRLQTPTGRVGDGAELTLEWLVIIQLMAELMLLECNLVFEVAAAHCTSFAGARMDDPDVALVRRPVGVGFATGVTPGPALAARDTVLDVLFVAGVQDSVAAFGTLFHKVPLGMQVPMAVADVLLQHGFVVELVAGAAQATDEVVSAIVLAQRLLVGERLQAGRTDACSWLRRRRRLGTRGYSFQLNFIISRRSGHDVVSIRSQCACWCVVWN